MGRIYRTAQGNKIDMDSIISKNEKVIAVGNKKVNARGDQLGAGGKIVKTRDQVMREQQQAAQSIPNNSGMSDNDNDIK